MNCSLGQVSRYRVVATKGVQVSTVASYGVLFASLLIFEQFPA